jgi:hypothetical protein
MEQRFGYSFGAVRLHTGQAAHAAARAQGAAAFTSGPHIVLGPGRGSLKGPEGRRLLVHELTHVVQQNRNAGGPGGAASEREAERNAHLASGNAPLPVAEGAPAGGIQRQDAKKKPEGKFAVSRGGGVKEGEPSNSFSFEASYSVPLTPGLHFGAVSFLDKLDFKLKGSTTSPEPLLDTTELQKLQIDLALRLARLELLKLKLGGGDTPGELSLGGGLSTTGGVGTGFGSDPSTTGTLGTKANLDLGLKSPSLLPSSAGKLTFGVGLGGEAGASTVLGPEGTSSVALGGKAKLEGNYESPALRGSVATLGGLLGDSARVKAGVEAGLSADWKQEIGEEGKSGSKLSGGGSLTLEGSGRGPFEAPFVQVKVTGEAAMDLQEMEIQRSNVSATVTGAVGFRF